MNDLSRSYRVARAVAAILALAQANAVRQAAVAAPPRLPVPCIANSCGPKAPQFVTYGNATAVQSGNSLTVNQTSTSAILNWQSFNIDAGASVQFNQPTSASVALNRIYQQNPSAIFGNLTANGQIYLVNPNGIVFGQGARVNAAGIIASSLGISDTNLKSGLLAPQILAGNQPALSAGDNVVDPTPGADGTVKPGDITVQAGAQITTANGRILLAGSNVKNGGTLTAPDGQVVLAAGQKVYLQANTDQSLRGLIVEVDAGGTAENQVGGVMDSARGNVSMIGLAVNQNGRISATTAVAANGSVRLEAADTTTVAVVTGSPSLISATHGGQLELGPQSTIDIEPELTSTATTVYNPTNAASNPLPSKVTLTGEQIVLDGASIKAPAGTLQVTATGNPSLGVGNNNSGAVSDPNARIRVHSGTSIDLSGVDFEQPMSANLLAVEVRSNELADDPTQRGGVLQGQTVYIDIRTGTSIIGQTALEAAEQAVQHPIAFFSTGGGTAQFLSAGDVVVAQGATVNVSGGRTTYDSGVLQTTQLVGTNGKLYDIGSANPLTSYKGIVNPTFSETFNKWGVKTEVATPGLGHYESGYVQGSSAGTVQFAGSEMVMDGTLTGHAVNGPLQRSGSSVASGGTLILGIPGGLTDSATGRTNFLTPDITFVNQSTPTIVADNSPLLLQQLQLPVSYLTFGGFTNTEVFGESSVSVPAGVPLNMLPGSNLSISAPHIDIRSDLTTAGGAVSLTTQQTADSAQDGAARQSVVIGDGVTIDVRGQWTNDTRLLGSNSTLAPTWLNGGSIFIGLQSGSPGAGESGRVIIGNDVSLRASGGAWVDPSNALHGGTGGKISIDGSAFESAMQLGDGIELDAYGVNGAKGGTFSLSAPRLVVNSGSSTGGWTQAQSIDELTAPGDAIKIGASLFSNFGFSEIDLEATAAPLPGTANADVLTIAAGTSVFATAQSLMVNPGYLLQASAPNVFGVTTATTLPVNQRTASTVKLSVAQTANDSTLNSSGLIDVQTGSSIITDPAGTISLAGGGGVYVDGTLQSPGGTITLEATTPSIVDPGYVQGLSVHVGPHAILDASGTFIQTPSKQGLLLGTVLNGGAVNLFADRGTVVTDAGSVIDVSGTAAVMDIPKQLGSNIYNRYTLGSAGGLLSVHSPESISLLGTMRAAAGVGNYGNPAGGSFALDLSQYQTHGWFKLISATGIVPQFPTSNFNIQLVSDTTGAALSSPASGLAVLGINQLESSGFDSLQLFSGSQIQLSSATPLNFARQVILDAPVLAVDNGINATVKTNYAALANSQITAPDLTGLMPGTGSLSVRAAQIDLLGSFGVSGARSVTLRSDGDVQLRGVVIGNANPVGGISVAGNLEIDAARIYPSTLTTFNVSALGDGSEITIGKQTNTTSEVPLSAGGVLNIQADVINTDGYLIAPFGQINLTAGTSLTLGADSVTSVSAGGSTILFGQTQLNQQQWIYNVIGASNLDQITAIPQRQISLQAPSVSLESSSTSKATVNLQGGGDLYAYEWVPGTGGTKDALSHTTNPGLYAIIPGMKSQFAPYDPQETPTSGLTAGQNIYISGGAGIAAGTYALLPARYALLPGAYLVQVEPGFNNIIPGQTASLADGTQVVAGYTTFGTTGLRNSAGGYQGVAIYPGSYGRELATYADSLASTYFAAAAANAGKSVPNLPGDAGELSISVDKSLFLAGNVLGNPLDSKSRGAVVDISATDLEIVPSSQSAASNPQAVTVAASVVDGWHVGSLVIGGKPSTDGASIDVRANTVTLDSGTQLSAGQVILVANQSIDLQSQSSLLSSSALSGGTAPAQLPIAHNVTLTSSGAPTSDAALLAVSDNGLPTVVRNAPSVAPATINLEKGSVVGSLGAISIDSPGAITLAGTVNGTGASWSLASSSIGFVDGDTAADTLQINSTVASELSSAGAIRLASQGAINLYQATQLGATTAGGGYSLTSLDISAQSINSQAAGSNGTFIAKAITLEGAATAAAPTSGSDTISFSGNEIDLGNGSLSLSGFKTAQLNATQLVVAKGNGSLQAAGDLAITAPVVTAALYSNPDEPENIPQAALGKFTAGGTLTLAAPAGSSVPTLSPNYLGGELDFQADTINQTGAVVVPSGLVSMQAAHDINLSGSARIDTAGTVVNVVGQSVGTAGGQILLLAGNSGDPAAATIGNLTLGSGTTLNVSGAGAAEAGKVALNATGAADLQGVFHGQAAAGAQSGEFLVEAGSLPQGLDTLSAQLQAGGFGKQVSVRTHMGDLALAAGSTITANQVSLTADSGMVDIAGVINAPLADVRGTIQLFGGAGATLESTGALHADTAGAAGIGGDIEIGTGNTGSINLTSGSVVSATGAAENGTLILRAPLIDGDTNIALRAAGNLSGLRQAIVEPIFTETVSGGTPDYTQIQTDITTKLASAAPALSTVLNGTGSVATVVRPAVDILAAGDLELDTDPIQALGRFNNQPVDLTIRAAGNLTVAATISDGFQTVKVPRVSGVGTINTTGMIQTNPDGTPYDSASIRLVAGADTASANPFAVVSGNNSALTINSGSAVRTGTGEIDLLSSGDINFQTGAEVYTAGISGAATIQLTASSPATTTALNFATGGGRVVVSAGRDITGAPVVASALNSGPNVSSWQVRETSADGFAQWGVDFNAYAQYGWNVGTLGGGDVIVNSGGNINTLSVAAADSYATTGPSGAATHFAGGGVTVQSRGDIGSGEFYVADGTSHLTAGGGFTAIIPDNSGFAGSAIWMSDSQIALNARLGIVIDAVVNPTIYAQVAKPRVGTTFFTYTEDSALTLQSSTGDVALNRNDDHVAALLGSVGQTLNQVFYPATLEAFAPSGDVKLPAVSALAELYPSTNGQLELVAGRDVTGAVGMSDSLPGSYPTVQNAVGGDLLTVDVGFAGNLHTSDTTPALVAAGRDIASVTLTLPKAADVLAGRDISNLVFRGENMSANDVTLLSAGRDFVDTLDAVNGLVQLGGPGRLDVLAGRDVNLGLSFGIVTLGDSVNANLPTSAGADVSIMAGLGEGADYASFMSKVVSTNSAEQAALVSYVQSQTGQSGLSFDAALSAFGQLSANQQRDFLNAEFFNQLGLSGAEANSIGYARGYAAIDSLFPNSRTAVATATSPYKGDVDLTFSRIYTTNGGNISIIAPGGGLDVGLANPPASIAPKLPSELGIVAEGPGNIDIYTKSDVIVNSSRIFTLGGGNILAWSDEGNIDAGRGAKSSTSAPPPQLSIDSQGIARLVFTGAVSGSGIRTIQVDPSVHPGNVELIAPLGTINAGDAGIGAAGNIILAAQHVLGVDNIQFGGTAVGVPPQVSDLGVALASVSNVASSATNSATASVDEAAKRNEAASPLAQAAISWLDVFVTGLGGDNCKPDDLECLKRQK
jgi:filamentous hemagglutinin family protein